MWRLYFLKRRDLLAIVLGVALVTGAALLYGIGWRPWGTFGFGPGWHCQSYAKGGPICFRDDGQLGKVQ